MINQLLLGSGIAVIAIGLVAPAIVSTGGPIAGGETRPVSPSESHSHIADVSRPIEPADESGFLGVVVALQSVELSAKFDGTLERLNVQVGESVKAGTPIARLDGRSIARDLAMAEASLRVAQADHDRGSIELADASDRRARLESAPELFSREQLEAAGSQEKIAAARLRGTVADLAGKQARTEQLREMLRDTQIVAPFDGTIAARYRDSGSTVSRGAPIVRVISPASLVIRFAVPEEQATGVAVGREVAVQVASVDLTSNGVIERIVPEIDPALRMVVVEARLADNSRLHIVPFGATARVQLRADPDRHPHDTVIVTPAISTPDASGADDR